MLCATYLASSIFSNKALTMVPYPVQLTVKTVKSLPIIIGGRLFFGQKHKIEDYLYAGIITFSLLLYQSPKIFKNNIDTGSPVGYLLLAIALCCDAFTGPRQDVYTSRYNLNFIDLMLMVNLPSCLLSGILLLLLNGLQPIWAMIEAGPRFALMLTIFLLTGSIGQMFIVRTLRSLGSLKLTLITTCRKFITILMSLMVYKHKLLFIQWLSICILLSTTLVKPVVKNLKTKNKSLKRFS
uniref:Solute carrier family 35 member B1-like n=1 Tax=Dermatophagoides pteronyssinus TaxID=6956 RepID=A0A6P6XM94_DERPT|nr:solute carrier family 35 member B1-like [Dermatophagoides pteronyssinus]